MPFQGWLQFPCGLSGYCDAEEALPTEEEVPRLLSLTTAEVDYPLPTALQVYEPAVLVAISFLSERRCDQTRADVHGFLPFPKLAHEDSERLGNLGLVPSRTDYPNVLSYIVSRNLG